MALGLSERESADETWLKQKVQTMKLILRWSGHMWMKRQFLPVGQGAFYCETFWFENVYCPPVNVVFDCGVLPNCPCARNSKKLRTFVSNHLGAVIPREMYTNNSINVVFLSHLHEDHVNGLEELKQQGVKIQRVYYPAVEKDDRELMDIWYQVVKQDGGLAQKLCKEQPRNIPGFGDTQWIPVPAGVPVEQEEQTPNADVVLLDAVSGHNTPLSKWEFLTFNFKCEDAMKALENAWFASGMTGDFTNANLMLEWNTPSGRDRVRKVYEIAFQKTHFHTNSMTVFSGLDPNSFQDPMIQCRYHARKLLGGKCLNLKRPCPLAYPNGCLYTGDYNASDSNLWNHLKSAYKFQWPRIGCLQVPHHGSKHGFNKDILTMNAVFVASMGRKNRYGHPAAEVEDDFKLANKQLLRVTDDENSHLVLDVF